MRLGSSSLQPQPSDASLPSVEPAQVPDRPSATAQLSQGRPCLLLEALLPAALCPIVTGHKQKCWVREGERDEGRGFAIDFWS